MTFDDDVDLHAIERIPVEEILNEDFEQSSVDKAEDYRLKKDYEDYLLDQEIREFEIRNEEVCCCTIEHEYDDYERCEEEALYRDFESVYDDCAAFEAGLDLEIHDKEN